MWLHRPSGCGGNARDPEQHVSDMKFLAEEQGHGRLAARSQPGAKPLAKACCLIDLLVPRRQAGEAFSCRPKYGARAQRGGGAFGGEPSITRESSCRSFSLQLIPRLRVKSRGAARSRIPARNKSFKLSVGLFRQHHLEGDILVSSRAIGACRPLLLQPQHSASVGPFWHCHSDRPGWCRYFDFAAEHRFL